MSTESTSTTKSSVKDSLLIRWRGKESGPYSASSIEAMLAANEISLLHEVLHGGHWRPVREYIAEREAIAKAERARLEEERRVLEEKQRRASELVAAQRAERLAEEKAALDAHRAADLLEQHLEKAPPPRARVSGVQTLGGLLLLMGLVAAAYFFLFFDQSVESGSGGRVNNVGLMADRHNGILVGLGFCVVGTILLVLDRRTPR
jgi:hypothetical protein